MKHILNVTMHKFELIKADVTMIWNISNFTYLKLCMYIFVLLIYIVLIVLLFTDNERHKRKDNKFISIDLSQEGYIIKINIYYIVTILFLTTGRKYIIKSL